MGRIAKDLTGLQFGKLTALFPNGKKKGSSIVWQCKCECGKEVELSQGDLCRKLRPTRSCGCGNDISKAREHAIQAIKLKAKRRAWRLAEALRSKSINEVAEEEGCSRQAVSIVVRREFGSLDAIRPPMQGAHVRKWKEEWNSLLGTKPDTELAKEFGVDQFTVLKYRTQLKIPAYQRPFKYEAGFKNHRITLLSPFHKDGRRWWRIECICGTFKDVLEDNVSRTKSCGCLRQEMYWLGSGRKSGKME